MADKDGTPAAKRQKHSVDGKYGEPQLRIPVAVVSNMQPSKLALFVDSKDTLQRVLGEALGARETGCSNGGSIGGVQPLSCACGLPPCL